MKEKKVTDSNLWREGQRKILFRVRYEFRGGGKLKEKEHITKFPKRYSKCDQMQMCTV